MIFLIKYWKHLILVVICFCLGFSSGKILGKSIGKKLGIEQCRVTQLEDTLTIREKHAKIRNNRPDRNEFIERMLEGSF